MLNLWLDDIRIPDKSYIWVKSFKQFKKEIIESFPDFISFDHDLGSGPTGYDCAKWLLTYCIEYNKSLPNFKVHSANPVGRHNIEHLLQHNRKYTKQ